ncbi:MAG: hypothetical protein A6F71_09240 [Cycloclasticus sp. symbiont of Poecilosclerida sp. M]|nr:MAG: hypothetical protein A6F71_09240 [Cycloclasticus sp. symbiont of Poecilosclerida sp. M]
MSTIEFIEVPEVNYTLASAELDTTAGSGSGDSFIMTPFVEPHFDDILETEEAGQMYAYRHNATTVALGTRKREVFGAAVGIGLVSNGMFKCIANNDYATDTIDMEVILLRVGKWC